jgi:hypothetical protein
MGNSRLSAYRAFRAADRRNAAPLPRPASAAPLPRPASAAQPTPLSRLTPYQRCMCGLCRECRDNARWDRIFAEKFAAKEPDVRGVFQSAFEEV